MRLRRPAKKPSSGKRFRPPMSELYEADEPAWLDKTARLIRQRRFEEIDYGNLAEFLSDMARRDRKEVKSRLVQLLAHLLKWEHQPGHRSRSWRNTIVEHREELEEDLSSSKTLRNHADKVLAEAYAKAIIKAARETGLEEKRFPSKCPYTIDALLTRPFAELLAEEEPQES